MEGDGELVLPGGNGDHAPVVRRGDTVVRPRPPQAALGEALLTHLDHVGFDGAPRFVRIDDQGRQVLTFVAGEVHHAPAWQFDPVENAARLGRVAGLVRRLHDALAALPVSPLAIATASLPVGGESWNHGDAHYGNVVWRDATPIALIDWDRVRVGHRSYDPLSLLLNAVGPRPDRGDNDARWAASQRALDAVAEGYGLDDDPCDWPRRVATIIDYAADELSTKTTPGTWAGADGMAASVARLRWRAAWWRDHS